MNDYVYTARQQHIRQRTLRVLPEETIKCGQHKKEKALMIV